MRPHLLILSNRSTDWGPSIQTHKLMGSFSPIHHMTWAPALITVLSDSTRNETRPSHSCHHASRREGLHPFPSWGRGGLQSLQQGVLSTMVQGFPVGSWSILSQLMQKWRQWKKSTVKSSTPRTTKHKRLWGGKQGWGNTKSRHQKISMSAKLNLNFTKLLDVMIMNNSHMGRAWPEHPKTLGHRSRYQTSEPNPKK